jgi:hypothetical protein
MSDYPQEVIDTLRNVIAAQDKVIKECHKVIDIDAEVIETLKAKLAKGE